MNVGRMPVEMNSPWARPLASTPSCSNAKISCMMIVSPSMPTTSVMLVTLRGPPCRRLAWMIRSTAEANCGRRARIGSSRPAMLIIVSSRLMASRGLLAWTVVIEPSWPVFMAWIMSSVSAPRHSPMMIRSGRIRRAFLTRSVAVTAPLPSMFGGRVSRRTTCSCWSCSSAASSMVMIRWSCWMKLESVFSSVVFPEPVPPEMMMLSRAFIAASISRSISGVKALNRSRSSWVSGFEPNIRIVRTGPSSASGGMIALTREPSGSRASTIGEVSSTRRPTRETIRSMICSRWSLSRKIDLRPLDPAPLLDEDVLRAVDHDVADPLVLEQDLQRAEAEGLVEDLVDQPLPLGAVEHRVLGVEQVLDDAADLDRGRVAGSISLTRLKSSRSTSWPWICRLIASNWATAGSGFGDSARARLGGGGGGGGGGVGVAAAAGGSAARPASGRGGRRGRRRGRAGRRPGRAGCVRIR